MILDLYANEIFDKGIYKFYVNLDNFNKIKDKLGLKSLDNSLVETIIYNNNNIFYCIYVGKTENSFLKRVINNHIGGTSKNSILRKILIGFFKMKEDELSHF